MEASTNIRDMIAGNKLFVPAYQRAYSWDTEKDSSKPPKQINTFFIDLENHIRSKSTSDYYFGHFLFEKKQSKKFGIIDGQQRMTTIVIFISAVFSQLKKGRKLTEEEIEIFEDIVKRNSTYRFETVEYDKQVFKDYVIDEIKKDSSNLETESSKRFIQAYDYFKGKLKDKDETYLLKLLDTVTGAACTTHSVSDESEAIQMFIFQNNRGKKPSNLEIIKAQFMFNIHLYAKGDKYDLIEEIKARFEKIYKSISSIEYKISEDDVLTYTLRVHFNSLWETNALERIDKLLAESNPLDFIRTFTHSLAVSFEHLTTFFIKDEKKSFAIHSFITLGGIGLGIPFIIKAYKFGLSLDEINKLCSSLESIILRNRLIGTRAELTTRINSEYQNFTDKSPNVDKIVEHFNWIKGVSNDSWWWAYWNNEKLEDAIQGKISHSIAKYLLWKYENELESSGKKGYSLTRYDKINRPELEHISPQTPTKDKPLAAGYSKYNEEFIQEYLDCLGNYLLLSKSHNCSVGNKPFKVKRASYEYLAQQREIQNMTENEGKWTKKLIKKRKDKIVQFVLDNL